MAQERQTLAAEKEWRMQLEDEVHYLREQVKYVQQKQTHADEVRETFFIFLC